MPNYCKECDAIKAFDEGGENTNIYWQSPKKLWLVGLNTHISPHLGRSYMIPRRHFGDEGIRYGFGALNAKEVAEMPFVYRNILNAIYQAFGCFGIKRVDNFRKGDIVHAEHPDLDFVPHYYESSLNFAGLKFDIEPGTTKDGKEILLASYARSPDLPLNVRKLVISDLKAHMPK